MIITVRIVSPVGDGNGPPSPPAGWIDHADKAAQREVVLVLSGSARRRAAAMIWGSRPRVAVDMVRVAMAKVRSAWPARASLAVPAPPGGPRRGMARFAVFPYRPALRDQYLRRTLDEDTKFAGLSRST